MTTRELEKRLSPEEQEIKVKRAELALLQEQLADVLAARGALERDLQAFITRSTQALAPEYAKLERWTIRCDELEWTVERLRAELEVDVPATPDPAEWERQRHDEFRDRWREAEAQADLADEEPLPAIGPR